MLCLHVAGTMTECPLTTVGEVSTYEMLKKKQQQQQQPQQNYMYREQESRKQYRELFKKKRNINCL